MNSFYCDIPKGIFGPELKINGKIVSKNEIHGIVGEFVMIGEGTEFGKGSKIGNYCKIGTNCKMNDYIIIEEHSTIIFKIEIGSKACIHAYTLINTHIPQLAVIHSYVNVPKGTILEDGAIVMRSPSSQELYVLSPPIRKIPGDYL